jgi:hypothetical protein
MKFVAIFGAEDTYLFCEQSKYGIKDHSMIKVIRLAIYLTLINHQLAFSLHVSYTADHSFHPQTSHISNLLTREADLAAITTNIFFRFLEIVKKR